MGFAHPQDLLSELSGEAMELVQAASVHLRVLSLPRASLGSQNVPTIYALLARLRVAQGPGGPDRIGAYASPLSVSRAVGLAVVEPYMRREIARHVSPPQQ